MFSDTKYVENNAQREWYMAWLRAVEAEAKARAQLEDHSERLKVCVLEIGCGKRIKTVRFESQSVASRISQAGAKCHIVRINAEQPELDGFGIGSATFVPLAGRGLECLDMIDQALKRRSNAMDQHGVRNSFRKAGAQVISRA
jgi:hypothetical protein